MTTGNGMFQRMEERVTRLKLITHSRACVQFKESLKVEDPGE